MPVYALNAHYLHSCKHEGYADMKWPDDWGRDVHLYPGLPDCGEVPPDGDGVPEQVSKQIHACSPASTF